VSVGTEEVGAATVEVPVGVAGAAIAAEGACGADGVPVP
jgi:hypothetical protein